MPGTFRITLLVLKSVTELALASIQSCWREEVAGALRRHERRSRRKMGQGEWFIYAQFRDLIQRKSLEV